MQGLVTAAVDEVLALAGTWLAWDGRAVLHDGNAWTPGKAMRRVTDHLIDHLAEVECRLAGRPTLPDHWHGRAVTTAADFARFTEVDLAEARSRLTRLAACYEARLAGLTDARLDQVDDTDPPTWTLRAVVEHVAGVTWYAQALGDRSVNVGSPVNGGPCRQGEQTDCVPAGDPL